MHKVCSTGKVFYFDQATAEEALIEHLGRGHYSTQSGPINVYACNICGGYHFTSKGEKHPMLNDPQVKGRIKRLRQAYDWENRF